MANNLAPVLRALRKRLGPGSKRQNFRSIWTGLGLDSLFSMLQSDDDPFDRKAEVRCYFRKPAIRRRRHELLDTTKYSTNWRRRGDPCREERGIAIFACKAKNKANQILLTPAYCSSDWVSTLICFLAAFIWKYKSCHVR